MDTKETKSESEMERLRGGRPGKRIAWTTPSQAVRVGGGGSSKTATPYKDREDKLTKEKNYGLRSLC